MPWLQLIMGNQNENHSSVFPYTTLVNKRETRARSIVTSFYRNNAMTHLSPFDNKVPFTIDNYSRMMIKPINCISRDDCRWLRKEETDFSTLLAELYTIITKKDNVHYVKSRVNLWASSDKGDVLGSSCDECKWSLCSWIVS